MGPSRSFISWLCTNSVEIPLLQICGFAIPVNAGELQGAVPFQQAVWVAALPGDPRSLPISTAGASSPHQKGSAEDVRFKKPFSPSAPRPHAPLLVVLLFPWRV